MSTAKHIKALLQSHIAGDEDRFISVATQLAAHEARLGHSKLADELRLLIAEARTRVQSVGRRGKGPVPLAKPRGELAQLLAARYSDIKLSTMVLSEELTNRLERVVAEQRQQVQLKAHGLSPRRKLLLVGPPGSGKTMTAAALAGELNLPLFTAIYEGLIGKFMGETSGRLKTIFEAVREQRGVYFFDEFDAIGAQRAGPHDVGEIRRVLNSFLQMLEADDGSSLIIAATNHPELLDRALYRRFDDVIEYDLPSESVIRGIIQARLAGLNLKVQDWSSVLQRAQGMSQAEISKAAEDAAKSAVLSGKNTVGEQHLLAALSERVTSDTRLNLWRSYLVTICT